MLEIQTQGSMMEGADKSTELRRHPYISKVISPNSRAGMGPGLFLWLRFAYIRLNHLFINKKILQQKQKRG